MSLKVDFILVATEDSMSEIEAMLTGVLNDVSFERHFTVDANLLATVSTVRDVNMLRVAASDLIQWERWKVMTNDGRWLRHRTDGPALIGRFDSDQEAKTRYFLWGIEVSEDWHGTLVEDGTAESEEKVRAWFDARYYE